MKRYTPFLVIGIIVGLGTDSWAEEPRVVLPLDDQGALSLSRLVESLTREAKLAPVASMPDVRLPVSGLTGALGRTFLEESLGPRLKVAFRADSVEIGWEQEDDREALASRVREVAFQARSQAVRDMRYGLRARASYQPSNRARPTVCLVHGMNSSSGGFVHLIPLIEAEGYGVVLYDYPFDRDLDLSTDQFTRDWTAFRERTGDELEWIILSHSMGGLLARAYVEGESYRGDVSDLILIAPPNQGSAIAELQPLMQWIRASQVFGGAKDRRKTGGLVTVREGLGAAADDLVPGSDFLKKLNSKPLRSGVRYHILAGNQGFLDKATRIQIESQLSKVGRAGGLIGGLSRIALGSMHAALDEVSDGTGDGCVSLASTRLEGVAEHRVIPVNHVELIRGPLLFPEAGPVACWPVVSRWLREAREARVADARAQ